MRRWDGIFEPSLPLKVLALVHAVLDDIDWQTFNHATSRNWQCFTCILLCICASSNASHFVWEGLFTSSHVLRIYSWETSCLSSPGNWEGGEKSNMWLYLKSRFDFTLHIVRVHSLEIGQLCHLCLLPKRQRQKWIHSKNIFARRAMYNLQCM